jgi:hypothetical protein
MNCGPLGITGLDGFAMLVAGVLAVGLIVGGALLVRSRRRSRATGAGAVVALILVAALGLSTLGAPPAVAADCPTPSPSPTNALRIDQTSVVVELRPGQAPSPIEGMVTNRKDEPLYVTAVVVSIVGVTLSPDAAPGSCDASDYVLLDPEMPVNEMVEPHESVAFSGASIGFLDQPWNQDACQGATVHLAYVTT